MRALVPAAVGLFFMASMDAAAEPLKYVLTDSRTNVHVDRFELEADDLSLGDSSKAKWSIHKRTLHGGKQQGVDVVTVDNGRMRMTIIPTRGMGILDVVCGELRLGWNSPVKEVVHPRLIRLDSRRGLGWLDGFNEWMVRCGLEFAGHPGTDKFVTNTGDVAEMDLSLHGKIANIPASYVDVVIDPEPPHRLTIRGRVEERMFFGPQLELWTEISTEPGATGLRIKDTIRNLGSGPQEFEIIYHANYGPPLLESGAKFVAALEHVAPMNDHAADGVEQFARYAGPTPGWVEKVYLLRPRADDDGNTIVMLRNESGNLGVAMAYSLEQLPYLTLWKNTADEATGYVTGIEPGTSHPYNRRVERKFGRVPKLAGGESREFQVDVDLLLDADAVGETAAKIDQISGGKEPHIDTKPPDITFDE